jgi:hypothetical protein
MNVSANKIVVFCRKSSDIENLSILAQETVINEFLKSHDVNTDNVSIKMTVIGSAYSDNKTHIKLLPFVKTKNIHICISDVTRLSRNLKLFNDIMLPIFKKYNTKICISNKNQILDMTKPLDLLTLRNGIIDAEKESQLKSALSKENYRRHQALKNSKNKHLTIDKMYEAKTGKIRNIPRGFYRSSCGNKCKIPEKYMMDKNRQKLIKKPFGYKESDSKLKKIFKNYDVESDDKSEEESDDKSEEESDEEEESDDESPKIKKTKYTYVKVCNKKTKLNSESEMESESESESEFEEYDDNSTEENPKKRKKQKINMKKIDELSANIAKIMNVLKIK